MLMRQAGPHVTPRKNGRKVQNDLSKGPYTNAHADNSSLFLPTVNLISLHCHVFTEWLLISLRRGGGREWSSAMQFQLVKFKGKRY